MENELYVYKEDGLSQENLYLKKRLVGFVKKLGYPLGCYSSGQSFTKALGMTYQNSFVEGRSHQERDEGHLWCVSGEFYLFVINSVICNMLTLVIIICLFNEGWRSTSPTKMGNSANSGRCVPLKHSMTEQFSFLLKTHRRCFQWLLAIVARGGFSNSYIVVEVRYHTPKEHWASTSKHQTFIILHEKDNKMVVNNQSAKFI